MAQILKSISTFAVGNKETKKPGFITCIYYQGEELPGLQCKDNNNMNYNKQYFEYFITSLFAGTWIEW